jgi:predicted AAA+ superfamily ATPase
MIDFSHLLELHELAIREGRQTSARRPLFEVLSQEQGRHLTGIVGPRGAGKTVLLKQIAASDQEAFYLSVDTLDVDADLFDVVRELSERYRFRRFLLDEIHFLKGAMGDLKKIHDFLPDLRVTFTGSVALAIHDSAHDLARRVRIHPLEYFSFREFLAIRHRETLEKIPLDHLLAGDFSAAHLRASRHFSSYLAGGLLPFSLEEPDPLPLLRNTIAQIIARDIPSTRPLRIDELPILEKFLAFIGKSQVDGINYTSLSKNLGITKYKAEQYCEAFERAFLLQRLFPAGTNVLREPKILLMPPLRLLHRPIDEAAGGLREDFFAMAMRQAGIPIEYLKSTTGQKTPDFLIEHGGQKIVFEIGGKGKGRSQFKGVKADQKIILAQGGSHAPGRVPLEMLGFLS